MLVDPRSARTHERPDDPHDDLAKLLGTPSPEDDRPDIICPRPSGGAYRAQETKEEGSLVVSNARSVNWDAAGRKREHLAKDTYMS